MPVGETVIKRQSKDDALTIHERSSGYKVYEKAYNALHGKGQFVLDMSHRVDGFPDHLLLPKGNNFFNTLNLFFIVIRNWTRLSFKVYLVY